jgi:hypothetical protein
MSLVKLSIKEFPYNETQNGAYSILNEVDEGKLPIVISI